MESQDAGHDSTLPTSSSWVGKSTKLSPNEPRLRALANRMQRSVREPTQYADPATTHRLPENAPFSTFIWVMPCLERALLRPSRQSVQQGGSKMNEGAGGSLLSWWQSASEHGAATALSSLCLELGRHSKPETATFLVRQALDLDPESFDALQLFEQLTPHAQRFELCTRYEAFVARVPEHPLSNRILERVMDLLLEQRRYDAALRLVGQALSQLAVQRESSEVALASAPSEREWSDFLEAFKDVPLDTAGGYAAAAE